MEAKIEYLATQYHKSPEKKTLEKNCKTTTPKRGLVCVLGGVLEWPFSSKIQEILKIEPRASKMGPRASREPKMEPRNPQNHYKIMILTSQI